MENDIKEILYPTDKPSAFKMLEGLDQSVIDYINSVNIIDPRIVFIHRQKINTKTKGGLFKPEDLMQKEARSTLWGQIIAISNLESSNELLLTKRARLNLGDWANFNAANPMSSGWPSQKDVQFIGAEDIYYTLSPEAFDKFIKTEDLIY